MAHDGIKRFKDAAAEKADRALHTGSRAVKAGASVVVLTTMLTTGGVVHASLTTRADQEALVQRIAQSGSIALAQQDVIGMADAFSTQQGPDGKSYAVFGDVEQKTASKYLAIKYGKGHPLPHERAEGDMPTSGKLRVTLDRVKKDMGSPKRVRTLTDAFDLGVDLLDRAIIAKYGLPSATVQFGKESAAPKAAPRASAEPDSAGIRISMTELEATQEIKGPVLAPQLLAAAERAITGKEPKNPSAQKAKAEITQPKAPDVIGGLIQKTNAEYAAKAAKKAERKGDQIGAFIHRMPEESTITKVQLRTAKMNPTQSLGTIKASDMGKKGPHHPASARRTAQGLHNRI